MRRIVDFFNNRYWLFLLIIVLVSYGQLLLMTPWQDDQTLFFKLQHIDEPAGYFGIGPFGEGPYRYIITPFIPIYQFFGLNSVYYYLLALVAYFAATYVVYKVFSDIVSKRAGRISGFLFAAGYVSSDSFIRLFNSVVTSASVIFVGLLILFYWRFYKTKKTRWYFLAIVAFLGAIEFVRTRTHYLITLPILFELIFFVAHSFKKNFFKSLVRLVPFVYIFYLYFIEVADPRSGQIKGLVESFLAGDFSVTYGFLSSLSNLVIPDWLSGPISQGLHPRFLWVGLLGSLSIFVLLTAKRKVSVIGILLLVVWYFLSKTIFLTPALNLGPKDLIFPYLGGVLLILSLFPLWLLKKDAKRLYLFLLLWALFNLGAYSAYNPTLAHNTIHRYLAHSFLPFVGLLGMGTALAYGKKNVISKVFLFSVMIWGVGNLLASFFYQKSIVLSRSIPVKNFYSQLQEHLPTLQKGDVIYFDVAENSHGEFADAFSVASMPEETAIAWRYGLDRYDIRRVVSFDDLQELLGTGTFTDINNNSLEIKNVYSFFYSKDGLIDTTSELKKHLNAPVRIESPKGIASTFDREVVIAFSEPISTVTPVVLNLQIKATAPLASSISYPFGSSKSLAENEVAKDADLRKSAFDYQRRKSGLLVGTTVSATSTWKKEVPEHLTDGRVDTSWRADRVLWSQNKAFFTLDLGSVLSFDRFVWVNGSASNSPIEYEILVSNDGRDWQLAARVSSFSRIEASDLQVVSFDKSQARFVRMNILETLSRDSASIAEAWVVPSDFAELDVKEAEKFLNFPLGFVSDEESFRQILAEMDYSGEVAVSWFGDKSDFWQTTPAAKIKVRYDGVLRNYQFLLPAGGTKIDKLKLSLDQIPGIIALNLQEK